MEIDDLKKAEYAAIEAAKNPDLLRNLVAECGGAEGIGWMASQLLAYRRLYPEAIQRAEKAESAAREMQKAVANAYRMTGIARSALKDAQGKATCF